MKTTIEKIIREAGEIIKNNFYEPKHVKHKGAIDLVTQFDIEIEKFLRNKLGDIFQHYSIIGEEFENNKNSLKNPNRIYIDPIDGTTNFVHSIPFVSISVAIYSGNKPFMGFVYNPVLDEFFYAESGKGSFLNGKRIKVSVTSNLSEALVTTGFPYSIRDDDSIFQWNIKAVAKVLKNTLAFRRLGSAAIDLCYLARGSYDIFYECNLKPWDIAAGILIVKEAGGTVTNASGNFYNIHSQDVIVASNKLLHNNFLKLLSI